MSAAAPSRPRQKSRSLDYGHGVSVSHLPNAAGHYVIRWMENGRRRSTKRRDVRDARELAQSLVEEAVRHGGGLRLVPTHGTALAIVDEYLASPEFRALVDRTQKQRRAFLTRRFAPIALRHPITDWSGAVDETLEASRSDGLSPSTIHRQYAELSAIGRWAVKAGILHPEATAYKFRKPRKAHRDVDDLPTPEQIEAAATALAPICDPLIVRIAAYCGPRIGELLALTVGDFDLENHAITIEKQIDGDGRPADRVKGGQGRTVYWPPFLDEEIRALVTTARSSGGRSARVFPYRRHQFEHRWEAARRQAGWTVPGSHRLRWRFHDLRHFFCSWALSKDGLDLAVADVSKLAGHFSPEFTYRQYVRSRPGLKDRVRGAGTTAGTLP